MVRYVLRVMHEQMIESNPLPDHVIIGKYQLKYLKNIEQHNCFQHW